MAQGIVGLVLMDDQDLYSQRFLEFFLELRLFILRTKTYSQNKFLA